jgi:MSHA biogenesis protein MshP
MSPRSRGFAMPMVIALVVVFATILGTALVRISSAQHVGFGLDLQGVRAYHAARSGLEWGMYHVLRPGFGDCAGIDGRTVVFTGNLSGFRATLTCRQSSHTEGGATVNMFAITASGCNDATACPATPFANYVDRQVSVTVAK